MNQEEAKSRLEATCKECRKLKEEHSNLVPILEGDNNKGKEIRAKQIELKRDYIKFLTMPPEFIGYDKVSSIHYCYTGCESSISRGEVK